MNLAVSILDLFKDTGYMHVEFIAGKPKPDEDLLPIIYEKLLEACGTEIPYSAFLSVITRLQKVGKLRLVGNEKHLVFACLPHHFKILEDLTRPARSDITVGVYARKKQIIEELTRSWSYLWKCSTKPSREGTSERRGNQSMTTLIIKGVGVSRSRANWLVLILAALRAARSTTKEEGELGYVCNTPKVVTLKMYEAALREYYHLNYEKRRNRLLGSKPLPGLQLPFPWQSRRNASSATEGALEF